jgi:hypothetical protein
MTTTEHLYDVYVRVGDIPECLIGSVPRGNTAADFMHGLADLLHHAGHTLIANLAADTSEPDCT